MNCRSGVVWLQCASVLLASAALAQSTYQKPPARVLRALHAPPPPDVFVSPTRDVIILATPVRYPPIAWLAEPVITLAGSRLNPRTQGPHGVSSWSAFTLVRVADRTQQKVSLPPGAKASSPQWSANGKQFAFELYGTDAVELWIGEVATAKVRRIPSVRLNPFLGYELQWLPDEKYLLAKLAVKGKGARPEPTAPVGPRVEETSGSSTSERRAGLRGPHEVELFEYFGTSQLAIIDVATGVVGPYGKPGVYRVVLSSPDDKNLLVESLHQPFSAFTSPDGFPTDVEIWSTGGLVTKVASLPRSDAVPVQGVAVGPRDFVWRPTEPATLIWTEALDGGDWKATVPSRDRVMALRAPFTEPPVELFKTTQRLSTFWWTEKGPVFTSEVDLLKRSLRLSLVSIDDPAVPTRVVWERRLDERSPGEPLLKRLPTGFAVVEQQGGSIFLRGADGSPEGDRPFLDRFEVTTLKAERLVRSEKGGCDLPIEWLDLKAGQLLVRHESPTEYPNVFVRTVGGASRQLTRLTDPLPELRGISKQLVRAKRTDGHEVSFTLSLPPGAKAGERLPTVVWLSAVDPHAVGFLLEGYALIDNPVVGDGSLEHLIGDVEAAVKQAVALGVTDPERIGVIGHGQGGVLTANLLAHTDLFRAGIARSGAYNRSLTSPPELDAKVSPLFSADRIKRPLLLIHGANDANPGTEPMQGEKLYEAIRGNGGTARLVLLPLESHDYVSMESNEHVLAESLQWFDRYVKHATPQLAPVKAE